MPSYDWRATTAGNAAVSPANTPGDHAACDAEIARLRARAEAAEVKLAAERERIAARMDELAAYYPEAVFPPDSDVRDSIGATAMRHAYRNAAREIRETP